MRSEGLTVKQLFRGGWTLVLGAMWMFLLNVATIRWLVFFRCWFGGVFMKCKCTYLLVKLSDGVVRQCCGEVGKLHDKWTFLFPVLVMITSDTVSMWNKTPRSVFWPAFLGKHVYKANLDYLSNQIQSCWFCSEARLEAFLSFHQDPLRGLCGRWWGEWRQAEWSHSCQLQANVQHMLVWVGHFVAEIMQMLVDIPAKIIEDWCRQETLACAHEWGWVCQTGQDGTAMQIESIKNTFIKFH